MTHLRVVKQKTEEVLASVYNIKDNEIPEVGTIIRVDGESLYVRNIVKSYELFDAWESLRVEKDSSLDESWHETWFIVEV